MTSPPDRGTCIQILNYIFPYELLAASQKPAFIPSPAIRLNIDFQHIDPEYSPMNFNCWNHELTNTEREGIAARSARSREAVESVHALRQVPDVFYSGGEGA
jgi:hypothetical protein